MIILKILIFLVLSVGAYWLAFIIALIGALGRIDYLIYNAGVVFFLGIPFLAISLFTKWITPKTKTWIWIIGALVTLGPVIGIEAYRAYDQKFTRLDDFYFDVDRYRPFDQYSRVVQLPEASTLSLSDNLPILDGARALYPIYSAFAEATYPEKRYSFESEVGYHNTIPAYERLINREADLIFVVSPSKEQLAAAAEKGVTMEFTPIGKDAFVFFVNVDNPINNLTSDEIRKIYSGEIKNWKEVGGDNRAIRPFQRNEGSGSQSAFRKFMEGFEIMAASREELMRGMDTIIDQTASYKNYPTAIGFSFRFFAQKMIANKEIKLLSIDGILPTIETIKSGEYPLTVDFYAAILKENKKPNVRALLEWILSPQGQWIIKETGYVPIVD